MEKETKIISEQDRYFVHHRIVSAVTGLIWLKIGTGVGHL
jgi:hypothetical protein